MNGEHQGAERLSRRDALRLSLASALGLSVAGWLPRTTFASHQRPSQRSCILLWMTGGASQMDTFDLKPGHANGGPFKEIQTAAPGVRISEHLPKVAASMQDLSIIRAMSTKEGDHQRATASVRTGYEATGPVQYPSIGSMLSKEMAYDELELPGYVSIGPFRQLSPAAFGPGFLGPQYAPLVVGAAGFGGSGQGFNDKMLEVRNMAPPANVTVKRADARLQLLKQLDNGFVQNHPGFSANSHRSAYAQAVRMIRSPAAAAFDLKNEPGSLRDAYGRNVFGQGCLLARRLIERGVPFVEVSLNGAGNGFGWDTHQDNFNGVRKLSELLDPAWGTLMRDLKERGLLESTMIVWMTEFGRTPQINSNTGRDHFPGAWSTVIGGGGIRGGQVIGKTSADGTKVEGPAVSHADLIATMCRGLGVDPMQQNMSNVGRPIRLADPNAKPIKELLV